jgi:hypothetical protein
MNETVILVGIGLILGALLSTGVWIVLYVINKAERQLARERSLLIKAIADESAEADKVLSSAVSKAMNVHALRSALLPKIDKMHKLITANMHSLDIYFVKYMELRIAWYKNSFEGEESLDDIAADRFPGEAQPKQADAAPQVVVQENRGRMEPSAPLAQHRAPAMPQMQPEEETIRVAQRAPLQKSPVSMAPAQQRMQPPAARPPQPREEAFDFEKAITAKTEQKPAVRPGGQLPPRAMPADHSEKTMQWDRNQLMGASAPPEAIVVEGSEVSRKAGPPKAPPVPGKPMPANKADASITGDDIESTMDSFFGLGDK